VVLELALGAAGMAAGMVGAVRLADLRDERAADTGDTADAADTGPSPWARVVVPVGAFVYLGASGAWDWATGGLENGLGMAWTGGTFLAVVALAGTRSPSGRRVAATAALVGLGVLVRPDFAVFCTGFLPLVAMAAWRRGRWGGLARAGAAAAALPLVAQVFRMGYYAQLVPNTLHAKEGGKAWWSHGWEYLADFVGTSVLLVPLVVVAAWLVADWRRAGRGDALVVVVGIEAAALVHAVGIVRAGGDYMHARLLLPAWFALLLPVLAVRASALVVPRRAAATVVLAGWVLVAAAFLRPAQDYDIRTVLTITSGDHPVVAGDMWNRYARFDFAADLGGRPGYHHITPEGRITTYRSATGRSVVAAEMLGIVGYWAPLDVWVHDRLGLADPVVARVALQHRGRPGHEKVLTGPWVAAAYIDPDERLPGDFARPSGFTAGNAGVPTRQSPQWFGAERAWATEALGCGGLGEIVHDTRAPLTPSRVLGNMVDAVRLHGLRFPAAPGAAREALCE
jgi:arabinofuranosyltransferase